MDKIFLIDPSEDPENPVKAYIAESGAECLEFSTAREALASGETPHVLLLFAGGNMTLFQNELRAVRSSPFFAKIARLLFLQRDVAQIVSRSKDLEGEMVFHIPVDKSLLLSRLAGIRRRSHRRLFELLIRIQPAGGNLLYFGRSRDFSETGMAFESAEPFEIGQKVTVSFVNPRNKIRIVLESEIIRRSVVSGAGSLYGARYSNVTPAVLREIEVFIAGAGEAVSGDNAS